MKGNIIVFVVALIMATLITGPKLFKMCQIRGWIPGAVVVQESVTDKWNQTPDIHPSGRNTFWISWGETSIEIKGNHRINLEEDDWNQIKIGQNIELLIIPGSDTVFLRDGIFADNGNFLFDILLLLIELGLAAKFGLQAFKEFKIQKNNMDGY